MSHDWFPQPLPENVRLGEESWLYSAFAFIHCRSTRPVALRTGRACGIYNGCFFELGPLGQVHIGDYSTLVGVIVATNSSVRIGSYCFLAHEVVVADSATAAPPMDDDRTRHAAEKISVVLGDDVWVGAGAVLLAGARIGDGAIVGAGAVVDFEVPPFSIVAGNPAKIVGHSEAADD
jgi:acetyltransferase-like isoleucine patch superfamily enzyme